MSLLQQIYDWVHSRKVSAKEIAIRIDKKPETLNREINPHDDGAKLGVTTLMAMMKTTGSSAPLAYMAAMMGLRLVDIDGADPDKTSIHAELCDDIPALAAYHESILDGEPVQEVHALLMVAIRELEENFILYRDGQKAA